MNSSFFSEVQAVGLVNGIIAMCMPFLVRLFYSAMDQVQQGFNLNDFWKWWNGKKSKHQRFIVYRSTRNSWGGMTSLSSDTQNAVLIKAIQLYLHHKCNLNLKSANLDLTSMEDKTLQQNGGYYDYDDDSDDDSDDEDGQSSSRKTLVGMLSKYSIVKKPPHNQWHNVGMFSSPNDFNSDGGTYPVELRIEEYEEDANKDGGNSQNKLCTTKLEFVSSGPRSIDAFIDKAYNWYIQELRSLEKNSRYLYELQPNSNCSSRRGDDCGDQPLYGGPVHVRYKLSDEKTFESLFFQQKKPLLRLIEHFENKTGKYAVKGYPHKLGLLLHGPPGTGKTSLIKALAQHTGRSIVNVPLSKISTNSELMSIFYDNKYYIKGEDVPVKLGFRDVIFVMEDVDACSKIVRRRRGRGTSDERQVQSDSLDGIQPKSIWQMLLESNEQDSRDLVELLLSKSEKLKKEATRPEVLCSLADRMQVLPGLGLVGESSGEGIVKKIGDDAIATANDLMDGYSTVERFVGTHAKSIKALLDSGAEVDDVFVGKLLDKELSGPCYGDHGRTVASFMDPTERVTSEHDTVGIEQESFSSDAMGAGVGATSGLEMIGPKEKMSYKVDKDQLNLTGLLNVLDGVVDTPGRILIMTTNHPELLDPALIRPGRIDKKLILGHMAFDDVISMLEHYFQTRLNHDQRRRVETVINGTSSHRQLKLTPAQVEQLTAEHDTVDDMIRVLEEQSGTNRLNGIPPYGTSVRKVNECEMFRSRSNSIGEVKRSE